MAPPITRAGFSELLRPDLHQVYIDTGLQNPTEFDKILNVIDMPYNPITDQQISGLGTVPVKDEGEPFDVDEPIMGGSVSYLAIPYGLAVEFTFEAWNDELYGVFSEIVMELQRASQNRLEVDAHAPLNLAESAAAAGFDGLSLINTAHTLLDGGANVSNRPAVDINFSWTAVQVATQAYHDLVDERGLPRLLSPSVALVTSAFYTDAREILGSSGRPYVASNEVNALIHEDLMWMVSHYITTPNKWFINARQGVHDMNFYIRNDPVFSMFDDPRTGNAVATVYQRHTSGFGTWRGVYGSIGA